MFRQTYTSQFSTLLPQYTESYRYGFQAQEKDDEMKGSGNSLNFEYRMHDPRIGRFFAVDPLTKKYPFYSPFIFSGNRVIDSYELEGQEPIKLNYSNIAGIAYDLSNAWFGDEIYDSWEYNARRGLTYRSRINQRQDFKSVVWDQLSTNYSVFGPGIQLIQGTPSQAIDGFFGRNKGENILDCAQFVQLTVLSAFRFQMGAEAFDKFFLNDAGKYDFFIMQHFSSGLQMVKLKTFDKSDKSQKRAVREASKYSIGSRMMLQKEGKQVSTNGEGDPSYNINIIKTGENEYTYQDGTGENFGSLEEIINHYAEKGIKYKLVEMNEYKLSKKAIKRNMRTHTTGVQQHQ